MKTLKARGNMGSTSFTGHGPVIGPRPNQLPLNSVNGVNVGCLTGYPPAMGKGLYIHYRSDLGNFNACSDQMQGVLKVCQRCAFTAKN